MFDISSIRIPDSPGCYLMKDSSGKIIYVGKAKNLKSRVASYFSKSSDLNDKTRMLVSEIASIDFVITDNEAEALVLESNLVKEHYPKYNIDLKDNEKFTYIRITNEPFPRMLLERKGRGKRARKPGRLFGPFTSGSANVLVATTLRKAFKMRICKVLPKRKCLQYDLGFCSAPCIGKISEDEYAKSARELSEVLSGRQPLGRVLAEMEKEMKNASSSTNFERAMQLRDSISKLEGLQIRQKMELSDLADEDFIAMHEENGRALVQIFKVVRGVVRDRKKYEFSIVGAEDALAGFITRYYSEGSVPRYVFIEREISGKSAIESFLSSRRGAPAEIRVPEIGDKRKLLELLKKNIYSEVAGHAEPALVSLREKLSLPTIPMTIEAFDISNLFGTNIVGSMVQFSNGKPNKQNYRKFKLRGVSSQDDFASMREVVLRRYMHLKGEGSKFPDLILIDGGLGQLNAALSALREAGVEIPCVSLAKEEEEIYHPERMLPIRLPRSDAGLKVLMHARDEAHRFVISYHRLLRRNEKK
jgi:excinuclease ABC subunit C